MQKKFIAVLLAVFFVSVAGVASAMDDYIGEGGDMFPEFPEAGDHTDYGLGNTSFEDDVSADNILIQGGANVVNIIGDIHSNLDPQSYLNAGNVANQINFDEGNFNNVSFAATAGNLVINDFSFTGGVPDLDQ